MDNYVKLTRWPELQIGHVTYHFSSFAALISMHHFIRTGIYWSDVFGYSNDSPFFVGQILKFYDRFPALSVLGGLCSGYPYPHQACQSARPLGEGRARAHPLLPRVSLHCWRSGWGLLPRRLLGQRRRSRGKRVKPRRGIRLQLRSARSTALADTLQCGCRENR